MGDVISVVWKIVKATGTAVKHFCKSLIPWIGDPRPVECAAQIIPGTCIVVVQFKFEEKRRERSVRAQLQRCDDASLKSWRVIQDNGKKAKIEEWYFVDDSEKKVPVCYYRVAVTLEKQTKQSADSADSVPEICPLGAKNVQYSDIISVDLRPQEASIIGVDFQGPSLTAIVKVKYQGDVYIALQRSEDPGFSAQWEDVDQYNPQFAVGQGEEEISRETEFIDTIEKNNWVYYYRLRVSRTEKWEFVAFSQPFFVAPSSTTVSFNDRLSIKKRRKNES